MLFWGLANAQSVAELANNTTAQYVYVVLCLAVTHKDPGYPLNLRSPTFVDYPTNETTTSR
jgi:hypothetical protein